MNLTKNKKKENVKCFSENIPVSHVYMFEVKLGTVMQTDKKKIQDSCEIKNKQNWLVFEFY